MALITLNANQSVFAFPGSSGQRDSALIVGKNTNGTDFRSFINFPIDQIPKDREIISARLELYVLSGNAADGNISAGRIFNAWNESTLTWNNQPGSYEGYNAQIVSNQPGWVYWDATDFVKHWVQYPLEALGLRLTDDRETLETSKSFASSRHPDSNLRPRLVVTYGHAPSRPTLTSPNGGEDIDKNHLITWQPSTDVETPQNQLRYHIQLSSNNGSSWKTIVALTDPGVVSVNYDFSSETESPISLLRIRAWDGEDYSAFDTSDGVFTIRHNVAPSAPTNLSPNGIPIDRTIPQRLSWRHNDPNVGDVQSKADVRWRTQGSPSWNPISVIGNTQETYIAPNTLPAGKIEWQVRTYDQLGWVGAWSDLAVFTAAEPSNTPVIVEPGEVVNVARPVVSWTSGMQSIYQIVVEDSVGAVVWDSGNVISSVKTRTIGADLANGGRYKVKVRIQDGSGLYSSYAEKEILVSYTPPAAPTISTYSDGSGVRLVIENPEPTNTQPNVTHMSLFKLVGEEYILFEDRISPVYTDYTTPSNTEVQYIVRVFGDNGTFTNSEVVTAQSPKLRGVWLHDVEDPELTIKQFLYVDRDSKSDSYRREHVYRQYAGRKRPVVEYGSPIDYGLKLTIQLAKDKLGRERLIQFLETGAVLLYRDGDGRKFYTTLPVLPMEQMFYGHQIDLELTEIDYQEGV